MGQLLFGIDIGGTTIKIGLLDENLKVLCKTAVDNHNQIEPADMVENIALGCEKLLNDNDISPETVIAVGIGAPGPLDMVSGVIKSAPNLKKFKNTPVRDMISKRLGMPAVLENDANAACWGERVAGAGAGIDDMVFFTLGTGVGGGIISDGKIVHGASGEAAEIGHVIIYPGERLCGCGQKGCIEAHSSATAAAAMATEKIQAGEKSSLAEIYNSNGAITCKDVFDASADGDKIAVEITETVARTLGIACVNVLHVTEPGRIVFGGGMIAAGDVFLKRIQHYFDEYIWTMKKENVEICFASLGSDAGMIGAAALASAL